MQNFLNLFEQKNNKANSELAKNIEELSTLQSVSEVLSNWHYKSVMTTPAQKKQWELQPLKEYVQKRLTAMADKKTAVLIDTLNNVATATRKISSISISVEWTKSRMWGNNPKCDIRVCFTDNTAKSYESERTSGCGYDKESTAIGQALNQCNELLNALYTIKNDNPTSQNRDLFGYGSGYGELPYFEGGVGVSCYPAIFKKIGLEWSSISHGKTFDVYSVELLKSIAE